jgi:hypothetical protein
MTGMIKGIECSCNSQEECTSVKQRMKPMVQRRMSSELLGVRDNPRVSRNQWQKSIKLWWHHGWMPLVYTCEPIQLIESPNQRWKTEHIVTLMVPEIPEWTTCMHAVNAIDMHRSRDSEYIIVTTVQRQVANYTTNHQNFGLEQCPKTRSSGSYSGPRRKPGFRNGFWTYVIPIIGYDKLLFTLRQGYK